MRLLHVLAERGFSGGEAQLRHLIHGLHANGHSNHLALAPGAAFGEFGRELGLPMFEVDLRRPWAWSTRRALRVAVGSVQPDVLHFGCGRSLLWGGFFCRRMQVPLKITTRRIDYAIGKSWFRGGRYRRLVDHTVANCESVRQRVLDAGVPGERVSLIHEGIDVEPWLGLGQQRVRARAALAIDEDVLVISCAASLRPRKGQAVLIDAFARIAADFPRSLLVLAGTGTEAKRYARRAQGAGLGQRIRIPGQVDPIADLYAASDLFCMPSFHEGLSNACLEASAAGLPLVVSGVGGLPEIVADGATGAVVPAGDVGALAAALARYLGDADLRSAAGVAGAARTARLFTAGRMAEAMETLLVRLLDARRIQD